jgi:hypothetical protein
LKAAQAYSGKNRQNKKLKKWRHGNLEQRMKEKEEPKTTG